MPMMPIRRRGRGSWHYLSSAGFLQDLADADVVLGNAWCRVAVPNPGPAVSEMSTSG